MYFATFSLLLLLGIAFDKDFNSLLKMQGIFSLPFPNRIGNQLKQLYGKWTSDFREDDERSSMTLSAIIDCLVAHVQEIQAMWDSPASASVSAKVDVMLLEVNMHSCTVLQTPCSFSNTIGRTKWEKKQPLRSDRTVCQFPQPDASGESSKAESVSPKRALHVEFSARKPELPSKRGHPYIHSTLKGCQQRPSSVRRKVEPLGTTKASAKMPCSLTAATGAERARGMDSDDEFENLRDTPLQKLFIPEAIERSAQPRSLEISEKNYRESNSCGQKPRGHRGQQNLPSRSHFSIRTLNSDSCVVIRAQSRQRRAAAVSGESEHPPGDDFDGKLTAIHRLDKGRLPGWAPRSVQSFSRTNPSSNEYMIDSKSPIYVPNIFTYNLKNLNKKFLGVMINAPLSTSMLHGAKNEEKNLISIEQLACLDLSACLADDALVCVWGHKGLIGDVVETMSKAWGAKYVENLTWVQLDSTMKIVSKRSRFSNNGHSTLLIGRRGTGNLELRHQRSPDVLISPVLASGRIPEAVRETLEVLLPSPSSRQRQPEFTSENVISSENEDPRLLEISFHGAEDTVRPGWIVLAQTTV